MKTKPYIQIHTYNYINLATLLDTAEVHALPSVDWALRPNVRSDAEDAIDAGFGKAVSWGDDGSVFVSCAYAIGLLGSIAQRQAAEDNLAVAEFINYIVSILNDAVPAEEQGDVLIELYQGA